VAQTILTLTGQSHLRPGQQIRMRVVGKDFSLPSSKATTLALILNELVQNAVEHGFPHRDEGWLEVRIAQDGPQIRVEVVNDGDPVPADFDIKQANSLGLQIVDSLTQNDLGGRFTLGSDQLTRASVEFSI
jgi:two-component sensor histidine kinase